MLQSGDIGQLRDEALARERFLTEIKALLPAEEAEHIVAASIDDDGRLVLTTDAAVWAARVRYRAEELGREQIRVRVAPRRG